MTQSMVRPCSVNGLVMAWGFALLFFVIFMLSPDGFSYDSEAYIGVAKHFASTPFSEALVEGWSFPYVESNGVKFEFGFAVLLYFITCIVPGKAAVVLIASLSLVIKLAMLNKLGVKNLLLISASFFFFVALFEGNAIRAGLAQSISMYGAILFLQGKLRKGTASMLLATCFHLSALYFMSIFILSAGLLMVKPELRFYYLFGCAFSIFLVDYVLAHSVINVGGKLGEYVSLKNEHGRYASHNPINTFSLLFFIFPGLTLVFLKPPVKAGRDIAFLLWAQASFAYMLFSFLPVVAERLWLYLFPFGLVFCEKLMRGFHQDTAGVIFKNCFYLSALILIVYKLYYVTPLVNFFYFLGFSNDLWLEVL